MVPGSYAEYARVPAERLVPLPDAVDARTAAASLLQGMTAHYLVTSTFRIEPGHVAVVHAAAGGAGGWVVQLAKQRGAHVVATASAAKHDEVRDLGADEVFEYDDPEWTQRSANVVYDSVGQTTFDRSLEAIGTRGMVVLFGQSSGPVDPVSSRAARRQERVPRPRPTLAHYAAEREELLWRSARDLRGDRVRRGAAPYRPRRAAGRRGRGAPPPRVARDAGQAAADPLSRFRCSARSSRRRRRAPPR